MNRIFIFNSWIHSILLLLVLILISSTCEGNGEDELDDEDEDSSIRRRVLLRKISLASEVERQTRSRGGSAPRPGNIPTYPHPQSINSNPAACKYCPTVACGRRNIATSTEHRKAKILDGIEADYGAYPWQVSIEKRGEGTRGRWVHICGGALISKFHVLTAAHCFRDTLSDFRVIVGNHFLNKTDVSEQIFEVKPGDFTNHRRFGYQSEYDNDISFVRLRSSVGDKGVRFNEHVHPICLPPEGSDLDSGVRCHVSGWGVQDRRSMHRVSSILRVAEVPVQSRRECQQAYHFDFDDLRDNFLRRLVPTRKSTLITDGNLCAGGDGPDACSGDSGGPLACTTPGQPNSVFLAGLVSWGKSCGGKLPGVYTKVSHYLKWIKNEIELSKPDYELY